MVFGKIFRTRFEKELSELYPRLWRYCLVLTKNRSDADDLTQLVMLRALDKASTYRDDGTLDRWLFRIAQRQWLNKVRARSVRLGRGVDPVEDCDLRDEKPGAETNIFLGQVLSAIMDLPEAQRMAVLLVYAEGRTYKEAALTLEVPVGTVMSRLATARRKLNQACPKDLDE